MKNSIPEIFKLSEEFLFLVSKEIDSAVENVETLELKNLLKYGLNQKGQMIRPGLVYFIAKALNENIDCSENSSLIHLASSVELLHTASLVHDDIIDNSSIRRGKESLYKHYGCSNAILTGNTFYLIAFDIANKNLSRTQVDSIIKAASDMCCGEIIQQDLKGKLIPHETYLNIIKKKTASIIKYACKESAGVSSGLTEDMIRMQELGENLGILYQLSDDCKDMDIYLEPGFDYILHADNYINKSKKIIKSLKDSVYKNAFENFLIYLTASF